MASRPVQPQAESPFATLLRRDWAALEGVAHAEQLRVTGLVQGRQRAALDATWAAIRGWLLDPFHVLPADLAGAERIAQATAQLADAAWTRANGGRTDHPQAAQWFGLIILARALREAFPEAVTA